MLTDAQKAIITATVPVLRENGVALTKHFYNRMLTHNPELRQIFSMTHQRTGHQAGALASAVLAYAQNIDNLAVLEQAVTHIAHKHVSVGIRAEHYPIVGHHLIESIREVLGEAATPDIIDAWSAAYAQLADVFINAEAQLYKDATLAPGGWSGWRSFVITEKRQETADVVSFILKPVDNGRVIDVVPGQYLSVRVYIKDENLVQPRQYTITEGAEDHLRITVKHIAAEGDKPEGMVSKTLHGAEVGTVVDIAAPMGEFTLPAGNDPLVLLSAGIGITPMVAMLKGVEEGREVLHMHTCRNPEDFVLRREVEGAIQGHAGRRLVEHYTETAGRPDEKTIASMVVPQADYVICGPDGYIVMAVRALKEAGVPANKIRFEHFSVGTPA